jgi:hypothetical protein
LYVWIEKRKRITCIYMYMTCMAFGWETWNSCRV